MGAEWLSALEATALATWLRESGSLWAYPLVLTLHTVGLAILVGSNVVIDLRLLGFGDAIPFAPLRRLFALMWAGFVVNAGSGLMLFMSAASSKAIQPVFWVKLGCITGGIVTIRLLWSTAFRDVDALASAATTPRARRLAIWSLVAWASAITAGRLMAYL